MPRTHAGPECKPQPPKVQAQCVSTRSDLVSSQSRSKVMLRVCPALGSPTKKEPAKMTSDLILRGRRIRRDVEGRVSLNDLHEAAGFSKNQRPSSWIGLPSTKQAIPAVSRGAARHRSPQSAAAAKLR